MDKINKTNVRLYRSVLDEDRVIINLASKEYSKCIEQYVTPEDRYITCIFGELQKGKIIQKGTMAKMARGDMVRYMAERNIQKIEELKQFSIGGYHFCSDLSSDREYVFLLEK